MLQQPLSRRRDYGIEADDQAVRELCDIAASLSRPQVRQAGILEPPPAMVREIGDWVSAQVAVNEIFYYRDYIPIMKDLIDGGHESAGKMDEIKDKMQSAIEVVKQYGIPAKKWNRVSRKFKADFSGSKYESLLSDAPNHQQADDEFGTITVELTSGEMRGDAAAWWDKRNKKIKISTFLSNPIKNLQHELVHFANDYMDVAMGISGFGNPSRSLMTPDINQNIRRDDRELIRRLRQQGIDRQMFHAHLRQHGVKVASELLMVARMMLSGTVEPPPAAVEQILDWAKNVQGFKVQNYFTRKFKLDLTDWRYNTMLDKAYPGLRPEDRSRGTTADRLYGTIEVRLVKEPDSRKSDGQWRPNDKVLELTDGPGLRGTIEHELAHWAQDYVDVVLGGGGKFGLPSGKIRTPGVGPEWWKPEVRRTIEQYGIDPEDIETIHDVQDTEFYPKLLDEIESFTRKLKQSPGLDVRHEFDEAVGLHGPAGLLFFRALKQHAPAKYQKAVKEFAKAVL